MQTREIITRYYEYANASNWDSWCDLFDPEMTMDEQLGGHVEGQATLRRMMSGFKNMYSTFQNIPQQLVIDGDQAAVVSRIEAVSTSGKNIQARVMNYFRMRDGKIIYMSNFHDTVPFQALTRV